MPCSACSDDLVKDQTVRRQQSPPIRSGIPAEERIDAKGMAAQVGDVLRRIHQFTTACRIGACNVMQCLRVRRKIIRAVVAAGNVGEFIGPMEERVANDPVALE